jgi:hypothetical protein
MSRTADRFTTTPTTAEAWVAYLRKSLFSLLPLLAVALVTVGDAVNGGRRLDGVTWITVAVAVAQVVGTYLPDNAIAKTAAGFVLALASVVAAAITDGRVTLAEGLVIASAFVAWLISTGTPNGAHPEIVRASQLDARVERA